MKKTLLTLLLLVLGVSLLHAAPLRVDIDTPANVVVDVDGTVATDVVSGMNEFDGRYVRVIANAGVSFTEVTFVDTYYNETDSWLSRVSLVDGLQYVDLHSSFPEDEYFIIRTASSSDVRSAELTVNCDDPLAVELYRGSSEELVSLQQGTTVVKFDPATESAFYLVPTGNKPPYKVMLNDTELTSNGYRYSFTAASGDVLDVQCVYPDIPAVITVEFASQDARDFLQTVELDGVLQPTIDFPEAHFNAKVGMGLTMRGNTTEYEVTEFTVNGRELSFINPFNLLIEGDLAITIAVRRYASFDMTVDVDDPSRVHVYQGYSYNGKEYTLTAGANTVEVFRDVPIISLVPAEGCYLESVSISGYDYTIEELQSSPLMIGSLKADEELKITTGVLDRTMRTAVYVQPGTPEFTLSYANRTPVLDVKAEGYSIVAYHERDNAFFLEFDDATSVFVYVDGVEIQPIYPGSPVFRPELTEEGVLQIYHSDDPATHVLMVEVDADAEGRFVLKRNYLQNLSAVSGVYTALSGTEFELVPLEEGISVKNGDEVLEPDAQDIYVISLTEDVTLRVSRLSSGIDNIVTDADAPVYYDLQGRPASATRPGIYVTRGAKVKK